MRRELRMPARWDRRHAFAVGLASVVFATGFATCPALGQSDPSGFATVYNLPADSGIVPLEFLSDTQINIRAGAYTSARHWFGPSSNGSNIEANLFGGFLDYGVRANGGSTVNFLGTEVAPGFRADPGCTLNVYSGRVGRGGRAAAGLTAMSGSNVVLRGGTLGSQNLLLEGSEVMIYGGAFEHNGSPVLEQPDTQPGDVIAGELSDGNVLVFLIGEDRVDSGTLTFIADPPPSADITPIVAQSDTDVPESLRPGQTLRVHEGATAPTQFRAIKATLFVDGGTVLKEAILVSCAATVTGGVVGESLDLVQGSTLELNDGGRIGGYAQVYDTSVLDVFGGTLGFRSSAIDGGTINVYAGVINQELEISGPSTLNVNAGLVEEGLTIRDGGSAVVSGGQIGAAMAVVAGGDVVMTGGEIGAEAQVNSGGVLGLIGGSVGTSLTVGPDGTVMIRGASVGVGMRVEGGGVVHMNAGSVGPGAVLENGAELHVSGGSVATGLTLNSGSVVNWSGGNLEQGIRVNAGATVTLDGSEFYVDDLRVNNLGHGEYITVVDRNASLTGTLADGSPVSLRLLTSLTFGEDYVDTESIVRVRFVSQPCTADLNGDGVLDQGDIQSFIPLFLAGEPAADYNGDGILDLGDIGAFVGAFLAGC